MGPNSLQFILKLQNLLTPGMRQAATESERASGKIKSQFTGIEYSGKRMGASINELHSRLDSLNQVRFGTTIKKEFDAATSAAKVLERQISHLEGKSKADKGNAGGGFGVGDFVKGTLISGGIGKVISMATSAGSAIISASVKEEQNKVGLKTFLGGAGANEAYNNIKKDAAITPFDTESLLMSNRALISAGASAKDARKDTLNLANAIAAVGGGNDELSRMATNMQQIKTVGKATAMDIKQFAFAGINIYKLLADATGQPIAKVKEMDVSYELLSRSLQHAAESGGAYFGALDAQSKTVGGKWSTFMDNLTNTAADIGTQLQPIFHFLLDMGISISDNFSKLMPYVQPVIDIINNIPGIISNITSGTSEWSSYFFTLKSVGMSMYATVKSILGNIWHITGGVIQWIGKSEMLKDLFSGIGKLIEGVLWVVRQMGDALQWIWDHTLKPILDAVEWVWGKVKGLFGGGKTEIVVTDGTPQMNGPVTPAMPEPITPQLYGGLANVFHLNPTPAAPVTPVSLNDVPASGKKDKTSSIGDDGTSKKRSEDINSGGQRSVVIHIGKQIEKLEVHVMDAKEGATEIEGMVREAMRRVAYSLNGVAV